MPGYLLPPLLLYSPDTSSPIRVIQWMISRALWEIIYENIHSLLESNIYSKENLLAPTYKTPFFA